MVIFDIWIYIDRVNYPPSKNNSLSVKPHKYETNGELPVMIIPFMKNIDFMWG